MENIKKSGAIGSAAILAGGSASALLLAMTAAPGGASTVLTVDSLADGAAQASDCTTPVVDSCSLRDAIAAAADGDTITFKSGLTGTILLTNGVLLVEDALTLTGPGSASITVDADGSKNVFYVTNSFGGNVVISGLTVTGSDGGAGIYARHAGDFELTDVNVTGNRGNYGGGLYISNYGSFTLRDSIVSNNTSINNGGGAYLYGEVTSATIINTTFADNYAGDGGGGIYNSSAPTLTISGSTFSGNTSADDGGALYDGVSGSVVTISDSVFSANSGEDGAALAFNGDERAGGHVVTINNTTITGNTASEEGGGVHFYGASLTINQSTIVENSARYGGGLYVDGGDVVLSGTIISNNSASRGEDGVDIYMFIDDGGLTLDHSLVGVVLPSESEITDLGGNIFSSDPGLSPLSDNGGRTMTMKLLPTSAAVDAGPSPVATFVGNEFDQRGFGYLRVVGPRVDIGAFEIQAPPAPEPPAPEPVIPKFTG